MNSNFEIINLPLKIRESVPLAKDKDHQKRDKKGKKKKRNRGKTDNVILSLDNDHELDKFQLEKVEINNNEKTPKSKKGVEIDIVIK